jgi:hypothetical protein
MHIILFYEIKKIEKLINAAFIWVSFLKMITFEKQQKYVLHLISNILDLCETERERSIMEFARNLELQKFLNFR